MIAPAVTLQVIKTPLQGIADALAEAEDVSEESEVPGLNKRGVMRVATEVGADEKGILCSTVLSNKNI